MHHELRSEAGDRVLVLLNHGMTVTLLLLLSSVPSVGACVMLLQGCVLVVTLPCKPAAGVWKRLSLWVRIFCYNMNEVSCFAALWTNGAGRLQVLVAFMGSDTFGYSVADGSVASIPSQCSDAVHG